MKHCQEYDNNVPRVHHEKKHQQVAEMIDQITFGDVCLAYQSRQIY